MAPIEHAHSANFVLPPSSGEVGKRHFSGGKQLNTFIKVQLIVQFSTTLNFIIKHYYYLVYLSLLILIHFHGGFACFNLAKRCEMGMYYYYYYY